MLNYNKPTGETMGEGSDIPGNKTPMHDSQEDCVPLTALASPGEDEHMNNPGVGDTVQYQKEGKVTRIEGDNAYVKVESVNGKPVTAEDAKTKDTPEEQGNMEFAQLKDEAAGRQMP